MQYYFYGDDSSLASSKQMSKMNVKDVRLFGGFYISQENQTRLYDSIIETKKRITGYEHAPVKWNIKDLKKDYQRLHATKVYEKVMVKSDELRTELLSLLSVHHATLRVSVVASLSDQPTNVRQVSSKLDKYSYVMILQRLGILQKVKVKASGFQVILDWPSSNDSRTFSEEHHSAYLTGKTYPISGESSQPYSCGPLKTLNFYPAVLFTKTLCNPFVQLADMVVGATRELVRGLIRRNGNYHKYDEAYSHMCKCYDRDGEGRIVGYGIVLDCRRQLNGVDLQSELAPALTELSTLQWQSEPKGKG